MANELRAPNGYVPLQEMTNPRLSVLIDEVLSNPESILTPM